MTLRDAAEVGSADDWIEVVLHFPGQLPLAAQGRIRHRSVSAQQQEIVGIEFLGLADALKEEFGAYVGAHLH